MGNHWPETLNFQVPPHDQWPRIIREETERRLRAACGQDASWPVRVELANDIYRSDIGLQLRCGTHLMTYTSVRNDLKLIPGGQMDEFAKKYIAPFVARVAEYEPFAEGVVPDV